MLNSSDTLYWSSWTLVQNNLNYYYTKTDSNSKFYSLKEDGTM
jgi:hypothetical protein